MVSIWSGHFDSQEEFGEYVQPGSDGASPFCRHAGLNTFDFGEFEAAFYVATPVPSVRALSEFPAGGVFAETAGAGLDGQAEAGWNSLVLLYDCAYSPERAHPSQACRMKYVGSFSYR
jgi:hypothetical protein